MFDLRKLLAGKRFTFSNEKQLQDALERLFDLESYELNIDWEREWHLNDRDIIDFYLPQEHIGIEVKIKGDVGSIIRQCERYLLHDCIETLYLVTSRQQHAALHEASIFHPISVEEGTIPGRCQLIVLEPSL